MSTEIKPRTDYLLHRTDKSDDGTDTYVGSTSQDLIHRLTRHHYAATHEDVREHNSKLNTRIRNVGIENWIITPLYISFIGKK